jgi:O-antigen/teichoic acid export membrane protein
MRAFSKYSGYFMVSTVTIQSTSALAFFLLLLVGSKKVRRPHSRVPNKSKQVLTIGLPSTGLGFLHVVVNNSVKLFIELYASGVLLPPSPVYLIAKAVLAVMKW